MTLESMLRQIRLIQRAKKVIEAKARARNSSIRRPSKNKQRNRSNSIVEAEVNDDDFKSTYGVANTSFQENNSSYLSDDELNIRNLSHSEAQPSVGTKKRIYSMTPGAM